MHPFNAPPACGAIMNAHKGAAQRCSKLPAREASGGHLCSALRARQPASAALPRLSTEHCSLRRPRSCRDNNGLPNLPSSWLQTAAPSPSHPAPAPRRDNISLPGLAKYFRESSEEEREHAQKVRSRALTGSAAAPLLECTHNRRQLAAEDAVSSNMRKWSGL